MPTDNPAVTPRVTTPSQSGKTAMSGRISVNKQEDDSQKRSQPPPKAWGPGVNPITQRPNTPSQANGASNRSNTKPGANNSTAAAASMDKSSDRYAQVLSHAMGFPCTFTTKEGGAFVGIPISLKGKQADLQFTFQNVRVAENSDFTRPQKHVAKPKYAGDGPQRTMSIASSQVSFLLASEAAGSTRPAQGKVFMTDTEISGNAPARERKLERWQAPSDSTAIFGDSNNSVEFDQFKVNEQKFGVKSTYNEEDYTTRIDRSSAGFAEKNARAARIAAEIEGNSKSNAWSEQLGANDEGYDEEDLYSGVRRDATPLSSGQTNRYVPPSRRSQQGTPSETVNDPAILSAQLAVPKTNATVEKPSQASDVPTTVKSPPTTEKSVALPKAVPGALVTGKSAATANLLAQPTTEASKAPAAVVSAFKQFANLEKLKVQNNKHMKNQQDKAVKVNDLKKFAKNFQLNTPVPKDLLPILAKDEAKQNEIVKRAQEQAEKKKKVQTEQKTFREPAVPMPKRQSESSASGNSKAANHGANTVTAPSHPLSQRLEHNRRQHKMGTAAGPSPMLPSHDNRQARQTSYSSGMPPPMASPTKPGVLRGPPPGVGTKLNAQVPEFKPSAMAPAFKPAASVSGNTNISSPSSHPVTRTITPVTVSGTGPIASVSLFREAKARDAKGMPRKSITWSIEAAKTIKPRDEENKSDSKDTSLAKIQQPFKQRVDWIPASQEDKVESLPKYKDQFVRDRMSRQPSFAGSGHGPQRTPHPGQYGGMNGGPNMHAIPMVGQLSHQMHGQHQHYPQGGHYEDHQMRHTPSAYSNYSGPSPRMHSAHPSPMPPGAQMGYPQGPYMNAGQGMPPRQFSNGPGGVPGPQMQPQMMMHQGPGPYMQQSMMPMQQHPQYPVHQGMYPGPPQPNGYPSPGRGAPAMMPSGSHQGHPQPYTPNGQYAQPYHPPPGQGMQHRNYGGQPNFAQNPYHGHVPYAARTPSHGYAQPHQQPPVMTPQAPPAQPVSAGNDETK